LAELDIYRAAKRGDKDAFLRAVAPLERRLYQTALGIVGNRHDAQDVWQDTVLKAWSSLPHLRQPEYFKTWFTRILLNEAKQVLRRRSRQPELYAELPEVPGESVDVEQYMLVHSGLQKMAPEQREAILLRYWMDLTLDEIAEATGVPLSTAKTRLYQGQRVLKEFIKEADLTCQDEKISTSK
jgi:RNA polymerase sigma-70 factor (ECF subfamily)